MTWGVERTGDNGGDPGAAAEIRAAVSRIRPAWTKGDLGTRLAVEIQMYSLFDLQIIGGRLNYEIERLPSPYREAIRPYFREQLFGKHHQLLSLYRDGKFLSMEAGLEKPDTYQQFCDILPEGCFSWDDSSERNPYFRNPKNRLFYYLITAFAMFVLDEPGHPVGMPFPGGFTVEKRDMDYYCLIRDREKDVFYSICNFCPALQDEETGSRKK